MARSSPGAVVHRFVLARMLADRVSMWGLHIFSHRQHPGLTTLAAVTTSTTHLLRAHLHVAQGMQCMLGLQSTHACASCMTGRR